MSNLVKEGFDPSWIISEVADYAVGAGIDLTEQELIHYLDYLISDLSWCHVSPFEIPYARVWNIRLRCKGNFLRFHVKIKRSLKDQLEEVSYSLWQLHGEPDGQSEYFWNMAHEKLKENLNVWCENCK